MRRLLGVKYRESGEPQRVGREQALPRPEALAALPAGLRQELADSVVSLDPKRIDAAIATVAELDAALAERLRGMHDRLAYTAMWTMLQQSRSESARSGSGSEAERDLCVKRLACDDSAVVSAGQDGQAANE
jgi:hypothetical protein